VVDLAKRSVIVYIAKLKSVVEQREVGTESEHVKDLTKQIVHLVILFGKCCSHFFIIAFKMGTVSWGWQD
jgi:hypothetical protein